MTTCILIIGSQWVGWAAESAYWICGWIHFADVGIHPMVITS